MKAKLLIIVVALVVSAANLALAERAEAIASVTEKALACWEDPCNEGGEAQCELHGCGPCNDLPAGKWCTEPPASPQ